MELKDIVAINGKPGLYEIKAQSKGGLIVESLIDGQKREKYEWDWPAVQPFLGVRFLVTEHLSLYSEYKYSYGNFTVKISQGEGKVAVEAHHLTLGAAVYF